MVGNLSWEVAQRSRKADVPGRWTSGGRRSTHVADVLAVISPTATGQHSGQAGKELPANWRLGIRNSELGRTAPDVQGVIAVKPFPSFATFFIPVFN